MIYNGFMLGVFKDYGFWPWKTVIIKKKNRFQAMFNRALTLSEWGMRDVSIPLYIKCLKFQPKNDAIHFKLAEDYRCSGQIDKAVVHYKECLAIDPDDPFGVTIKLYLLQGNVLPDCLPIKYVERLFTQYAPHFDKNLIDGLHYSVPRTTGQLLQEMGFTPENILDLGCGTGLSAAPYRSVATTIHGVDVSTGMLAQAEKKTIYDALYRQPIHDFLKHCSTTYDLILALDVFIYTGRLDDIVPLAGKCLAPTGIFAFSTQLADDGVILGADHRYAHGDGYIQDVVKAAGLRVVQSHHCVIRIEHGTDVPGMIYLCGRG